MTRIFPSVIVSILLVPPLVDHALAQNADIRETPEKCDARAFNLTFGETYIAENARSVSRRAAELDPSNRFVFLVRWVLPNATHPDFRVDGILTQTDPSPLAIELEPAIHRSPRGATIVSPVFDLLDAAAETGKLVELRDRVDETPERDDAFQRRARTALQVLVYLEMRDFERAESALSRLRELAALPQPERLHDLWPETLVVYRGLQQLPDYLPVGDLVTLLYSQRTMQRASPAIDEWHTQIVSLLEQFQHPGDAAQLKEFVPVARTRAKSRGPGAAHPRWIRTDDNAVQHVAGHQEEYLFYRSPLRGDFTVECDVGCYGTTDVLAAGRLFGVANQLDRLSTGTFRNGSQTQPFDPPFSRMRDWVRYRAVFQDDTLTVFFNGRLVHEEQLPEHYDPWIGIKGWWRNPARFRDFRITGRPEVPDSVVMSASPALTGWLPYHEDSAGFGGAHWEWRDDPDTTGQLVASRDDRFAGSFCESLLRYQRPLDESGSVEYDFFYEADAVLGHPALDRLAFILRPDGVRIHWITDAPFDRTEVPPDNLIDEPDHRRGPTPLPLHAGEWNHLKLSLQGDVARVELNGEPVFERTIEHSNRRTFGLFQFADQTEVRVRNVVMRGDWAEVPSAGHQDLADARVAELDASRDRLPSVFTHDFRDGLPADHFRLMGNNNGSQSITADGVFATNTSPGSWSSVSIVSRFAMLGDFDVEASFENLDTGTKELTEGESTILLIVKVDGDPIQQVRSGRTRHVGGESARGQLFLQYPDGTNRNVDVFLPDESTSGRLRVARRGDTVDMLFAQGDSSQFRVIAEHSGIEGPVAIDGIQLNVITNKGAHCGVVWKDLTLRAEQLQYAPEDEKMRRLYVYQADGSLRELAAPPGNFTHLGSPEWSPDGSRVTLDVSTGSTSTSHIFVIDADSGQATDLGAGCMPSFSSDGSRIVFSQPGQGIMMMNTDGTGRRVIDSGGWGVQWSPDGEHIAWGDSGNVTLRDVATSKQRPLLRGPEATRYDYIYWNLGWSHDSRSIAFKARHRQTGEYELAVVDVDTGDVRVLYSTAGSMNADFTFSPDDEQVLFAMTSPEQPGPRLFVCNRNEPGPPTLLPGQPPDMKIFDCAWSSNGHIAFAGQRIPQPIDWPIPRKPEQRSE